MPKLTILTDYTAPVAADILYVVKAADTSSKKVTLANLFSGMSTPLTTMTENVAPTADDILYLVDNPLVAPTSNKITIANLFLNAPATTITGILTVIGATSTVIVNNENLIVNSYTHVSTLYNTAGALFSYNVKSKLSDGIPDQMQVANTFSSAHAIRMSTLSDGIQFHTYGAVVAGDSFEGERMRINIAGNVLIGTTTDGMTALGSLAIAKDLAHRGTKIGFYNKAPAVQPTKAGHNNWAAVGDVVQALVDIGLFDAA